MTMGESRPTTVAALFSDPNCPFCFATEERLHALELEHRVEWRGVQHAPHLPVPMHHSSHPFGEDLNGEVMAIRARAPEVPIEVPPGKPNTALAIQMGAAALAVDPDGGRRFVRLLYSAFWVDGADLSVPAVLDELGERAGVGRPKADRSSAATADSWQESWQRSGAAGVPLLVRRDGRTVYGLAEPNELRAFLSVAEGVLD